MKIHPDRSNPQHFVLSEVSAQELRNIIQMVNATSWRITPWGKGIIERFSNAVRDNSKFFFDTSW